MNIFFSVLTAKYLKDIYKETSKKCSAPWWDNELVHLSCRWIWGSDFNPWTPKMHQKTSTILTKYPRFPIPFLGYEINLKCPPKCYCMRLKLPAIKLIIFGWNKKCKFHLQLSVTPPLLIPLKSAHFSMISLILLS